MNMDADLVGMQVLIDVILGPKKVQPKIQLARLVLDLQVVPEIVYPVCSV